MSASSSALDLGVQLWTTPSLVSRLNHQDAAPDEGSGGGIGGGGSVGSVGSSAGWAPRRPLAESMLCGLCASLEGPGGLGLGAEPPEAWDVSAGQHWERPFFVYQRLNAEVSCAVLVSELRLFPFPQKTKMRTGFIDKKKREKKLQCACKWLVALVGQTTRGA